VKRALRRVAGTAPLPQVSVIVPAYNAQETLRETLNSALASTYRDLEIIVVDDGSTDRTFGIARDVAEQDRRVRIIRRENGGLSAALNSGFAVARGEYVARLDADDLWHPSKLEHQLEFARRHQDVAFIYTFARYIDGEGRVVRDGPNQPFPPRAFCRGIYESLVGGGSSALIKRSAVVEVGGCDEAFRNWEDLLLQLAVTRRLPIGCVPLFLVGYRIRPESLSKDIDQMVRGWRAVRSKLSSKYRLVPRFVLRWAHGVRCGMFAEGFAWRRRYLASAALLFEAAAHDPVWVYRFVRFRLSRRARKSTALVTVIAPCFLDCDPAEEVVVDPSTNGLAHFRFAEFEERRAQTLAEADRHLAKRFEVE